MISLLFKGFYFGVNCAEEVVTFYEKARIDNTELFEIMAKIFGSLLNVLVDELYIRVRREAFIEKNNIKLTMR